MSALDTLDGKHVSRSLRSSIVDRTGCCTFDIPRNTTSAVRSRFDRLSPLKVPILSQRQSQWSYEADVLSTRGKIAVSSVTHACRATYSCSAVLQTVGFLETTHADVPSGLLTAGPSSSALHTYIEASEFVLH